MLPQVEHGLLPRPAQPGGITLIILTLAIHFTMVVCRRQEQCVADECEGKWQGEARSRSQEDVSKMRLIQRRRNLLLANQSVSLDHGDTG